VDNLPDHIAALGQPATQARAPRVLVSGRDAGCRDGLLSQLMAQGYDAQEADEEDAVTAILASHAFDILLTCTQCADLDEWRTLVRVRRMAPELPIVVVADDPPTAEARQAVEMGASDIVSRAAAERELGLIIERNLARHAAHASRDRRTAIQLIRSYETVLDALLSALDTRNPETQEHTETVTALTMLLAQEMGLSRDEMYHLERGALLHDIGKIGVPDRILLKAGPLTDEEWVEMRSHPVIGFRMCARIDFLRGAAQIVLHHHERWDGRGYPDGLRREAVPLGARVLAVIDAWEAMTGRRPYRQRLGFEAARAEIQRVSGSQFDPQVVRAFSAIPVARLRRAMELLGKRAAA